MTTAPGVAAPPGTGSTDHLFKSPGREPRAELPLLAALAGLILAADGLAALHARAETRPEAPPQTIGACGTATVLSKRFRMAPSPGDSGYAPSPSPLGKEVLISLNNGIGLYAGDGDAFILSRDFAPGHRVTLCLLSLPQHCPPGDNRGKVYAITDRQTRRSLRGIDAWHLCGGA